MAGKPKKTTNQFKQEVFNLVGNEYTVLGEYVNNRTKIKMKHNICGNEYEVTPTHFISSERRCPKCSKRKTTNQFKQEVFNLVGDEYTVLGEYITTSTKILMKHNKCGYEYYVKPNNFNNGDRCPKCSGHMKRTNDDFKQEVFDLVGDEYTVLSEYVNSKTKILMKHNVCGYKYYVKPILFTRGRRCPKCAIEIIRDKLTKTPEEYIKEVFNLVKDEYTLLEDYKGNKAKLRMKHNTCGREFLSRPNDFLQGYGCPYCAREGGKSKLEEEISDYIKSIYNDEIIENDRTILGNKEIDIYLPDKNIAFEFDGLYWHSEKHKDKNYHLLKTIRCQAEGIRLIHIFEDEWINKQDIVKSKIKHLLGLNTNEKIYARKCFIEEISTKDKNQFLNENHIQGEDRSSIKLGLWYPINDEESMLVSVMTFCKPRFTKDQSKYDYELSRFASEINYNVIGGFSKVLSYFKKNYEWKSIVTYADRRWSIGNVYEKNGFNLHHISKPSYWYCLGGNIREHRSKYQKKKLKKLFPDIYDKNLSETEIMKLTKYNRIYDCGNFVYEYYK